MDKIKPKSKAKIVTPPNTFKAKVGSGGLDEHILARAQELLENHSEAFAPLAEIYLNAMLDGINYAKTPDGETNNEEAIEKILLPCVQLKANGTMFHYPLVTRVAGRFIQFMEVVERIDKPILEIATAVHSTIKIVIAGKIKGNGGKEGENLIDELDNACMRYFEKHKKKT